MKNVLKMVGNYTAHAICHVAEGNVLLPFVGYLKADGNHSMEQLVMDSADAAYLGDQKINRLTDEHRGAVFIVDGVVTLGSGKTDALIINVKFRDDNSKHIVFLLPYRNVNNAHGFAIHRLEISKISGFTPEDYRWITDAFFDGLESHAEGKKIWQEHYEDKAVASVSSCGDENTDFSTEDFEKLKQSPFLIFFLIAAADGKIDKKEVVEFMKVITHQDMLNNSLFNRIITNVINDVSSMVSSMAAKNINYISELITLKSILDKKLAKDDANKFKLSLFQLAKKIAESSGGILGFGKKISKEESAALATIALCLDIRM